ncbi:MAG: tRNA lysidine(34) synthetase TilS [Solirubrobacterales bacterium]
MESAAGPRPRDRDAALAELAAAVEASGLVARSCSVVVMVSGGADSACAAGALARVLDPARVHALHVNYGLRDGAAADERACRDLCGDLRLDLHVERPELTDGNVQAAAREARYAAAERLRARSGAEVIVTGHTRTDQVETVLYRLAVSPGARGLLGLSPRNGRVVRPLLGLDRADTRRLAAAAGLRFSDDKTNDDPAFARNRVRLQALPVLRDLNSAAERNIAETRAELAEDAALLERVVLTELEAMGTGAGSVAVAAAELARREPALQRLALRALAERAAGRSVALGRARAAEIMRVAASPEGGTVELGGGLRAVCESGSVGFATGRTPDAAPVPVALDLPGIARLGRWELRAELHPGPVRPAGPDLATLDAAALEGKIEVRTWREGDRMQPLGMEGTKTLGDLLADGGIPRSARSSIPIVTVAGEVAWVPGVAVGERFRLGERTDLVAVLTARLAE